MANLKNAHTTNRETGIIKKMSPGCSLNVEINTPTPVRFSCQLIGYEIGSYLLISVPAGLREKYHNASLVSGYEIVIRSLLDGGKCLAFTCEIESVVTYPHKFMCLSFPKSIETCELRQHTRVATCITGEIKNTGCETISSISGCVHDISLGGCCFIFDIPGDVPSDIKKVNYRNLQIYLGDITKPASIFSGMIKSQKKLFNQMRLGIQFSSQQKNTADLIARLYINLTSLQ
jgi:hypothetical protein